MFSGFPFGDLKNNMKFTILFTVLFLAYTHLEHLSISNNFPEDLGHIHIKQAAPPPLKGDALTPLADMGPCNPEGLRLEGSNLLMPLHTKVQSGGLAGAI